MKRIISFLMLGVVISGCGYGLQRSDRTPFFQHEGIRTVFVAPIENFTFKAGAENLVYNQIIKVLASNRRLRLVHTEKDADAILTGTVSDASYGAVANVTASDLFPKDLVSGVSRGSADVRVATEYQGSLSCSFALNRRVAEKGRVSSLWSGGFSKSKPFPANNQLGVFGTTSALINESEFDRVLRDLAEGIAADMHESMLAGF